MTETAPETAPELTPEAIAAALAAANFCRYDPKASDPIGFVVRKADLMDALVVTVRGADLGDYGPGEGPRTLVGDYAEALGLAGYEVRVVVNDVIVSGAMTETTETGTTADPFGGHEFHYEGHTDLFRCIRCHRYEVSVRKGDGPGEFEPCMGEPPAGSKIEVNIF